MTIPTRSLLFLSIIAIILAACGTAATSAPPASEAPSTPQASASPEPSVEPTVEPSVEPTVEPTVEPSEEPAQTPVANPTVAGTLTQIGAAVDGPGGSLADALAGDLSEPVFVRGALFLDTDGKVYLAESLVDAEAPTFGDLRVLVANYPTDGPTWDMANADLIGLQEANGIRYFPDTKIYGTLTQ